MVLSYLFDVLLTLAEEQLGADAEELGAVAVGTSALSEELGAVAVGTSAGHETAAGHRPPASLAC